MTALLAGLNPQQQAAVTAPLEPALVLAGPGSGKTRVLTHRLAYLVEQLQVQPDRIVALTFTNKAAQEMQARVRQLIPGTSLQDAHLNVSTFHAFAARLLRRESARTPLGREFVIFDEDDQLQLVQQALRELNLDPQRIQPGRVHGAISRAKNELVEPQQYPSGTYFEEVTRRVYERYQQLLLQHNAMDFDDLLLWPVRLFRDQPELLTSYRRRYPHLLVDEFQDTNTAQYVLLRLLAGDRPHLFVVGDPDQSIYRWRGADYRNVLRIRQDFPQLKIYLLEQNYRSTQNILDTAMAVMQPQPDRHPIRLFTQRGQGEPILLHEAYDQNDEASFVVETIAQLTFTNRAEPRDCAVMYRTNAQSRALEEAFLKANLPYQLVGAQRFYGRREVKDLIAYLRLVHNPDDQLSLLRVINTPARGIGQKTVQQLLDCAQHNRVAAGQLLLLLAQDHAISGLNGFSPRARSRLSEFGGMLQVWIELKPRLSLKGLIDRILRDSGYLGYLDDGSEEGVERAANVLELRDLAAELSPLGLSEFLEQLALVSDQDTLTESLNAPTLLTLHAAKGLEFPIVFIVGLDEGQLPHHRSMEDSEALAEERRLFYVGLTRAKDRIFLLRAFRRRLGGSANICDPSRFLQDLPADRVQGDLIDLAQRALASYARQTRWDDPLSAPSQPRFMAGMHVRHPTFGDGVVTRTEIQRGDEEITVEFEAVGVKRLIASLAQLEIQDDPG